jgi:hypothetical protein
MTSQFLRFSYSYIFSIPKGPLKRGEEILQAGITVGREEDTRYYHQAPVAVIMLVVRGGRAGPSGQTGSRHRMA